MREEIVVSGFGGQGIMLAGKFIAYIAMKEGHHVTYMPSYGAEMRGGTANCTIIISSEEIASPLSSGPTTVLVLNKPSFKKFSPRLRKGGLLIFNSSLIDKTPERRDIKAVAVPANELAEEAGNVRSANMVMVGVYLGIKKLASAEKACELLKDVLPERWHGLIEVNKKSIIGGENHAK